MTPPDCCTPAEPCRDCWCDDCQAEPPCLCEIEDRKLAAYLDGDPE